MKKCGEWVQKHANKWTQKEDPPTEKVYLMNGSLLNDYIQSIMDFPEIVLLTQDDLCYILCKEGKAIIKLADITTVNASSIMKAYKTGIVRQSRKGKASSIRINMLKVCAMTRAFFVQDKAALQSIVDTADAKKQETKSGQSEKSTKTGDSEDSDSEDSEELTPKSTNNAQNADLDDEHDSGDQSEESLADAKATIDLRALRRTILTEETEELDLSGLREEKSGNAGQTAKSDEIEPMIDLTEVSEETQKNVNICSAEQKTDTAMVLNKENIANIANHTNQVLTVSADDSNTAQSSETKENKKNESQKSLPRGRRTGESNEQYRVRKERERSRDRTGNDSHGRGRGGSGRQPVRHGRGGSGRQPVRGRGGRGRGGRGRGRGGSGGGANEPTINVRVAAVNADGVQK